MKDQRPRDLLHMVVDVGVRIVEEERTKVTGSFEA